MLTKEMLIGQLNQVVISKDGDNGKDTIPLSRPEDSKLNAKETKRERKRKNENIEKTPLKKKKELEWKPEDCAQPVGKLIKFTGAGLKKKCHYGNFEFHGIKYGLEDSVLLMPEKANQKSYAAIIKDIYIQGKEGYVKLEVQWFYRPEDVEKKHVGNWNSKDSRDIFYSFHRDEVSAESVKRSCTVYFVPENKNIPDRREHPGFIVQNVYDFVTKKLRKFTDNDFNEQQKHEIDSLLAKTMSLVGDLPDIEKKHKIKKSKRKQSRSIIMKAGRVSPESSNVVYMSEYKLILENFDMLTGDSNRDKRLEELLEAVKHKCRVTKKEKASDYDSFWPDDAVPVVRALEQVLYDSMAEDMRGYNNVVELLVDKLKNSRMLAERILNGELKPEQVKTMTGYELMSGHTFGEITAVIDEPIPKSDDPSTSGPKV